MANRPELQTTRDQFGRVISNKHVMRTVRHEKRREAELRNSKTVPDNRRSHWRSLGFIRKSHAARVISSTVAEANQIAEDVKARSGLDDWSPDHDPATADLLREIFSGSEPR